MAGPDLSEFESLSRPRRSKCSIAVVLEKLAGEAQDLRAALAAERITSAAISTWLGKRGEDVKAETVSRHRRGQCSCDA